MGGTVKVFISWSGERSREAAEVLHSWLRRVLPGHFDPWMSAKDLHAGGRWATDLAEKLDVMNAGISVLTRENLGSTWLHYEAGAIGKAVGSSRVMTFLIGLTPGDVEQPLGQFQHTLLTQASVLKMVSELNSMTPNPVTPDVVGEAVSMWWPKLVEPLTAIEERRLDVANAPSRDQADMLEEVLTLLRGMNRTMAKSDTRRLLSDADFSETRPGGLPATEEEIVRSRAGRLAGHIRRRIRRTLGEDGVAGIRFLWAPDLPGLVVVTPSPLPRQLLSDISAMGQSVPPIYNLGLHVRTQRDVRGLDAGILVELPEDLIIE